MAKNKKRKNSHGDNVNQNNDGGDMKRTSSAKKPAAAKTKIHHDTNPLLTAQQKFLNSLSSKARTHFFSPTHVTPDERAEIWENQADLGEKFINSYAWATPDPRLLKVFQHFGPIIEIGCGANAYWSRWMHTEGNVDVIAYDLSLDDGGMITSAEKKKSRKKNETKDGNIKSGGLAIRQGGPEVLSEDEEIRDSKRTLFLCYPDEEDQNDVGEGEGEQPPISMAASCLEHFTGNTIIHVGELYGDTLSLEQAPFGRSSSSEFQQRLAGEYHCILKMKLDNNWLHVRDTLSVWKRSETCVMAFEDEEDDNDNSDDDMYYKYIPPEEVLPSDLAAPCVAHLLVKSDDNTANGNGKSEKKSSIQDLTDSKTESKIGENSKKKKKKVKKVEHDAIAGNAW